MEAKNYSVSTYYYVFEGFEEKDVLEVLCNEIQKSEQLIIIFLCHGAYEEACYYLKLNRLYSSLEIILRLLKPVAADIFIYTIACQGGYFFDCCPLKSNWIYVSASNQSGTAGLSAEGSKGVEKTLCPATQCFIATMANCCSVEEAYWLTLPSFGS